MDWFSFLTGKRRGKRAPATAAPSLKIRQLENLLGYSFRRSELLFTALKHRSYLEDIGEDRLLSNERLEFLGDAVLDLVVSEYYFRLRPKDEEGTLTSIKSVIVSGPVLVAQARKMGLGDYLFFGANERNSGGRERHSILEDAFEALIGAIYLDGGLKPARQFIQKFLLADAEEILNRSSLKNYKSMLLEYAQSLGLEQPLYSVIEESGPDHDKRYTVAVSLNGQELGTGAGRSKKQAEQCAAKEGMRKIEEESA